MPAIPKPLTEITTADLTQLIAAGWAEDDHLEFKETLPSGGTTPDRWLVDQHSVGDIAKRKVLAEVVAMANSYGGDVVLGMRETEAKPHRAEEITPLPQCEDLARRFEMFARDHIRPPIPMLAVRGVLSGGNSGALVFRVPASRLAPHRLEIGNIKECYRRTRDRTEAMSMREMQDLTLDRERGAAKVEDRFHRLRARFEEYCQHKHCADHFISSYSFTVRAVPLASEFNLTKVHGVKELVPYSGDAYLVFHDGARYECPAYRHTSVWTPMLRGTRLLDTTPTSQNLIRNLIELTADGSYLACTYENTKKVPENERYVMLSWVFNMLIAACASVDRVRSYVGGESVEYALELQITVFSAVHRLLALGAYHPGQPSLAQISESILFPRYSLGVPRERGELLTLIYDDLLSALGKDSKGDRIVEVSTY